MSYSKHVMGKWLWRGYIHSGGHLIGRWRDTFTPEHLRGHEGPFGMVRSGDPFWPESYPSRIGGNPDINIAQVAQATQSLQGQGEQAPGQDNTGAGSGPVSIASLLNDGNAGQSGIGTTDISARGLAAIGSPEANMGAQLYGQAGPVEDGESEGMDVDDAGSRAVKRMRDE
jgi:hypothetical protein